MIKYLNGRVFFIATTSEWYVAVKRLKYSDHIALGRFAIVSAKKSNVFPDTYKE